MTGPLSILVEEMSLPAGSPQEAAQVAGALRDSLEQMFAQDQAAGLVWRGSLDRLTLDLPEGRGCEETGRAIARALRDRLAGPEPAR